MSNTLLKTACFFGAVLLMLTHTACHTAGRKTKSGECTNQPTTLPDTLVPMRIVSAAPLITEVIFALGQSHRLVGRTDYCYYPPAAAAVQSIGSLKEPSIETIIDLKPDLMINSTHFKSDVAEKIERLGVRMARVFNQNTIDGAYLTIQQTADLLGCPAKADSLIAVMEAQKQAVMAQIQKEQTKPTVYYVVGYGKNGDFTAGGNTFINDLINMAGGTNIAADLKGWNYNLETLMDKNPDIIILRKGWKEAFCRQSPYLKLNAVKNNRVFEIDNHQLELNGPRIMEALAILANIIHPPQ